MFVRWLVPLGYFAMGFGAQFAYRGEYKKGREHRVGWTSQLCVGLAGLLLPVMLFAYGGSGLSVWSSVIATSAILLAMEPPVTFPVLHAEDVSWLGCLRAIMGMLSTP